MKTLIYCFTATGNSLYAAQVLASGLPDSVVLPMTREAPAEKVGGPDTRLGFVFPSHYGKLPRQVKTFIEGLDILPGTYCFGLVTMGGVGAGTISYLDDALKSRGCRLAYGVAVRMAGNYIMRYNPDPLGKSGKGEAIEKKLRALAVDIGSASKNNTRRFKFASNRLYNDILSLDALFRATDDCDACGTCQRLCPAGNIELEDGKPVWKHTCQHCTACINWCPRGAIEYGDKTKNFKRYHHPGIQLKDMLDFMDNQDQN